jgi:hypothetical protein
MPPEGIAEALHDLSDHTAALARRKVDSALRETWNKARQSGPPAALLAASGVLALFATVSAYRLSLRLLEKRVSPAVAALAATSGYGAAAAASGETARETAGAVAEATVRRGGSTSHSHRSAAGHAE